MAIIGNDEITNDIGMFYKSYEPKTKNRFVFRVDAIPAYLVKKADRPKPSFEEITLDHINMQRKLKGRVSWGDITCELYDPINPSGAQAAMNWFRLHHETVTGRDGYQDFYKKTVNIQSLGPVGDVVEDWELRGAFIKSIDFSDLDWSNANTAQTITLTLAMDYCVLKY
jgi:hypothetical protein